MCYLIAKPKVSGSGSNPIQPIFSFGRKKPFSETHFAFDFSTELFYFGFYHYFFFIYFIFYISFVLQYFIYFISADTNQRNLVALLSESLDSASESVFLRQRTIGPCLLSTAMSICQYCR